MTSFFLPCNEHEAVNCLSADFASANYPEFAVVTLLPFLGRMTWQVVYECEILGDVTSRCMPVEPMKKVILGHAC